MTDCKQSEKQYAITAVMRLYFPFYTPSWLRFRAEALCKKQWSIDKGIDTRFYLGYIHRIFNSNGLRGDCLVLRREIQSEQLLVFGHALSVSHARIFSFDTSIGFLELNIPYACNKPDKISDIMAFLRCSNFPRLPCGEKERECLNSVATRILTGLGEFTLFDHLAKNGETRPELFVTLLADQKTEELPLHAHRIARALHSSHEAEVSEMNAYAKFSHTQWEISEYGVCNVGILTGNEQNDVFLNKNWFAHSESRYIPWYILALHQKYALYHFLNEIAQKNDMRNLRKTQKKIVLFNTKYRFRIVSEEIDYQRHYEQFCELIGLDKQFDDIDDEIERISDYHETVGSAKNNASMTIIALVCTLSVLQEFYDLIEGGSLITAIKNAYANLSVGGVILYGAFLCIIVAAIFILLPAKEWIRAIGHRIHCTLLEIKLFFHRKK